MYSVFIGYGITSCLSRSRGLILIGRFRFSIKSVFKYFSKADKKYKPFFQLQNFNTTYYQKNIQLSEK